MITVYVWKPTLYGGLDTILDVHRGYERTHKSSYDGNLTRNPFDETNAIIANMNEGMKVKLEKFILALQSNTTQEFARQVGHASLLVTLKDGRQEYLSFWPADSKKLFDRSEFVKNYTEDIKKCKAKADDPPINLLNLNDEEVYNFIVDCKKEQAKGKKYIRYNLFSQNCSTLVMLALLKGTQTSPFAKTKDFVSRIWKSLEATGVYATTAAGLWSAFRGSGHESLSVILSSPDVQKKHFSSSKSLFSVAESLVHTPNSVLEYANRISQLK